MPPKSQQASSRSGRTPKKGDSKTPNGWQKDASGDALVCDVDGALLLPGVYVRGYLRQADGDAAPKSGPKQDHYVFLHTKTMEACQMSIGDNVLLTGTDQKVVCTAWPSSTLRLADVSVWSPSMRSLSLSAQDMVTVSKVTGEVPLAHSVTLKSSIALPPSFNDVFKRYLIRVLDRRMFFLSNCIEVSYCGENAAFTVSDCTLATAAAIAAPTSAPATPGVPSAYASFDRSATRSVSTTPISMATQHSTPVSMPAQHSTPVARQPTSSVLSSSSSSSALSEKPAADSSSLAMGLSSMSLQDSPVQASAGLASTPFHPGGPPAQLAGASPFVWSATETSLVLDAPGQVRKGMPKQLALDVTFADIGGLKQQIEELTDAFVPPMSTEIGTVVGYPRTRGVLLHGPVRSGKTLLLRALVRELAIPHVYVNGGSLTESPSEDLEQLLSDAFAQALKHPRCILVIEGIDQLCPPVNTETTDSLKTTRKTLISLMDSLEQSSSSSSADGSVMVLATAVSEDAVCPSMRADGRLSDCIEVLPPTTDERVQILDIMLGKMKHNLTKEDIARLAGKANGYVGGDLVKVFEQAGKQCGKRLLATPCATADDMYMTLADIELGMRKVKPSAMMGITVEVPKVRWSDIGGLSEVKKKLSHVVEFPLKYRKNFEEAGRPRPRGALMYGPPGCSKTMIARALATESGMNFIAVKGPELFNKYVGESERSVREVFRRARAASPSIIFFDEIDALGVKREGENQSSRVGDRVVTQLLTEMDGVEQLGEVIVIAATNRPDALDQALLRPGRFGSLIYVPLPDPETRREIFSIEFRKTKVTDDVSLDHLVSRTIGYSGAEIVQVVTEAFLRSLEDGTGGLVSKEHIDTGLSCIKPNTSTAQISMYEQYASKRR
eukprot:scpid40684/ scgid6231/ Spermatogenesis-associated protein 5; Spermatogenesis-associated factor protein